MATKPLAKIKHGELVLGVIPEARFFNDIARSTSLDVKTLQQTLANLAKNGYIVKDSKDQWTIPVTE